ncbi:class I SAM-dependent methyltransferase [Anaerobacillus sp. MEB173]|uniref:class I SAM-dependent methyltransferase n=1 Tax=Anaerobacillus sp. MEB173 TaxID=3383345 RepID=UPI003F8E9A38
MDDKEIKENVKSQFGKNAKNYVTSKWHAKGKDLAKLIEIAELTGEEYVLDIATGGGHTANALAPLSRKVVALDITDQIIDVARKFIEGNGNNNVEFVKGDAESLPFSDETFDIITCRIAAHHFSNISSFVKESFRTLKKNGTFLLIDNVSPEREEFDQFYNKVEKDRDYSHERAYKKSEWIKILEENGFEIEESYRFTKTFIFDDWCKLMNFSGEEKEQLSDFMLRSSKEILDKFRIKTENNKVYSFMGESILLKIRKPNF